MKKPYYFLLLFFFIIQTGFTQVDSLIFKHSIVVNINDFFINRLFVTYSKPINSRDLLELSCGYMYSNKENVEASSYSFFNDALWYYNALTLRVGVKRYFHNSLLFGISSNFNYNFFDNIRFNRYEDYEGELNDRDYVISRTKYQVGGLIKFGLYTRRYKHLFIEKYIGVGLSYSIEDESISSMYDYADNLINRAYPIVTSQNRIVPTYHIGLSIGLKR
jgi:hypothetical protein